MIDFCSKCGSQSISHDLSTNKKYCRSCGSSEMEVVDEFEYLKKLKRLEKRINVFGSLEPDDPEDEVRI